LPVPVSFNDARMMTLPVYSIVWNHSEWPCSLVFEKRQE